MNSGGTVKTTVRLPADLHWQFQGERAARRLSNEKAICEALAVWIANRPEHGNGKQEGFRGQRAASAPRARERECVDRLLEILRDSGNPDRALTVSAVLQALSGRRRLDGKFTQEPHMPEERLAQLQPANNERGAVRKTRPVRMRRGAQKAGDGKGSAGNGAGNHDADD
jgi:hypothetical protein